MAKIIRLNEDVIKGMPQAPAVTVVVKNAPPTISGCKILGFKSRNNRNYTREAIQKAAHKYENVKVNLDHNTGTDPRKFSERFGRIVNVKMKADGLYGDLQYNPKHPLAEAFQWWIKNDPSAIGLSHNATAEVKNTAEGGELVTEIREVDSVDLVADPATTKGLFESYNERNVMNPDMLDNEPTEMTPPMEAPPVDAVPEADKNEGDYATHLGNAIMSIINDATLSSDDKKKKILGALKLMDDETVPENEDMGMQDDAMPVDENHEMDEPDGDEIEEGEDDEAAKMEAALMGSDDDMPMPAAAPAKKAAYESVQIAKLKLELDAYRVQENQRKKRAKIIRTCKESKMPAAHITPLFIQQLMKIKESTWGALIKDRQSVAKRISQKPVSTSVVETEQSLNTFVKELLNN